MKIKIVYLLPFLLLIAACKKRYATLGPKIITSYDYTYNADSNITKVSAVFNTTKLNGSLGQIVLLRPGASVTVNGQVLSRFIANGPSGYGHTFAGRVDTATFVHTDHRGNIYTNTFHLDSISLLPVHDTIFKDSTLYFPWTGIALDDAEEYRFNLNGGLFGGYEGKFMTITNQDSVPLQGELLEIYNDGAYNLAIQRLKQLELDEKTGDYGTARILYYSNSIPVVLK